MLALDHEGHPIGAAWYHFPDGPLVVTPDGAPVPELLIALTPKDRGRGVGRSLLDAVASHAADHGYDRLALSVHIRSPAARLYGRAGFVVAGKGRGHFRRGNGPGRPSGQFTHDNPCYRA